ncbi:MAG: hypothetical protein MJE77_36290 [Proteobacteria bacterium]|nr:hypothetical protein [Pseudomonadota bacterium]
MRKYGPICIGAVISLLFTGTAANSQPPGSTVLCQSYPDSGQCVAGDAQCTICHTVPPERNPFGAAVSAELAPGETRPLPTSTFVAALPDALHAVESADADGDGVSNLDEILAGSLPGDPGSTPGAAACPRAGSNPDYAVCAYDPAYAFKKMMLDFCGHSPTWDDMEAFRALADETAQRQHIATGLATCLDSEFWLGKDGELWRIAHPKVRPLQALKMGDDRGTIPLADYYDDYNLFVYTQIDDHDARDVLLADYFVQRNGTVYTRVDELTGQNMQRDRRAGFLTTNWFLVYNIMFAPLPRAAAARAYRSFLGLDIARLQGLDPEPGELVDYDGKNVTAPACRVCHSTLDPLSYAFSNYNGVTGRRPEWGTYNPARLERYFPDQNPTLYEMPENGVVLGQPVSNLNEWVQVAAASDAFARTTVLDYWRHLLKREPLTAELPVVASLIEAFRGRHNYSVEAMLHEFVQSEVYGAP